MEELCIDLNQICRKGVSFATFTEEIICSAFAYKYDELVEKAKANNICWHQYIVEHTLIGLYNGNYKSAVLAFYAFRQNMIIIYLCSRKDLSFKYFYKMLGYMESSSRDILPGDARPVVLWQPPHIYNLWPLCVDKYAIDSAFVLDAGNLADYSTIAGDKKLVERIANDQAYYNDYCIVPGVDRVEIPYKGKSMIVHNRFYKLFI